MRITPGQKVLIHAGSGGVGTFAIQLAKHLGSTVATTASAANAALVKELGGDIVIDYRSQEFEEELSGYDLVLNSLDAKTLEKSLKVLRPRGKLISISGPPDPAFAKAQGLNAVLRLVLRLMSAGIRRKAKRAGVDYSFFFMRADGEQLGRIAKLIEDSIIRPVVDRTTRSKSSTRPSPISRRGAPSRRHRPRGRNGYRARRPGVTAAHGQGRADVPQSPILPLVHLHRRRQAGGEGVSRAIEEADEGS